MTTQPETSTQTAPKFPNIEFLGRGYDLLLTDPLDYASSGVKATVIALQYQKSTTAQVESSSFRFPDGTQNAPDPGGTTSLTFQQMFRQTDYQSQFGETATISGGIPLIAKFSLSESYSQSFNQKSSTQSSTLYTWREVRLVTVNFTPALDDPPPMVMDTDFANAVGNLSTSSASDPTYQQFIQQFGTHYSTSVGFGGRAYQYTVVEATTFSSMVAQNIDIQAGASGAFDIFTGSASGSYNQQNTQNYQQATESSTTLKNFSGGRPFDDWDHWVSSVVDQPVPIALTLAPLSDLLTSTNFPNDANIGTKQGFLETAISNYLQANGAALANPQPLQSGSTQFYLVNANGQFLSRTQDPSESGNLAMVSNPTSSGAFMYNGPSPLAPDTFMALTNNTFGGHVDAAADGDQVVFTFASNNTYLQTQMVSVFNNPANPVSGLGTLPSSVMTGDQVYVLHKTAGAMQASGSQVLAQSNPTAGDPSLIWTVMVGSGD
ncbi:MAC/perforin domain-containing protein [Deinococcus misasensis]|uniref:MAC/perforin domain-containing protein n=1 Tax=Deinococcus misasensis TaxID=392413 RepID=UPI00055753DF|nr:MAC/perforin domain-containing protein [Deinococcus misasensis]